MKLHLPKLPKLPRSYMPKKHTMIILGLISLIILYRRHKRQFASKAILKKAASKRKSRDSLLDQQLPLANLSLEKIEEVRNATLARLSEMLNNDEVTSRDILLVFCHRVQSIGKDLELIADVNFIEALKMAQICDEKRKNTPKEERAVLGPLFGIPISVKDNMKLKGLDATYGLIGLCFNSQTENAAVIEMLIQRGAIPFVKSNAPQMMMTMETVNHIWGRGKNPWNFERAVGGSSGGEAGLVASRCSPVGIGADVAGSIRIPALFCGVYGIKPTVERVSRKGLVFPNKEGLNGNNIIKTAVGPIGRCVDDLRIVLKEMMHEDMVKLDPVVCRQSWDSSWEEKPLKKMKIGYIDNDNFFEVCDANRRAVSEACEALKKRGHEIVALNGLMTPLKESQTIYTGIFTSEGKLRSFHKALNGEPMIDEYKQFVALSMLPMRLRKVLVFILWLLGQRRAAILIQHSGEKKAYELFDYVMKMEMIRQDLVKLWKLHELDAIITPGMALPAIKHGQSIGLHINACYTNFWNLVNFPTGAVPITKVREGETKYDNPLRMHKGDRFDTLAKECLVGAENLPVGIQISTLPFEEEKCLAVMKEIEDVIGFHELPL